MSAFVGHRRLGQRAWSSCALAMALAACGGGGGGSDTGSPPTPALATDRERTEAATGAALTLISLAATLVTDAPRAVGGPAGPGLEHTSRSVRAAIGGEADGEAQRAVRVPCAGGGTLDGSCSERDGITTVSSRSFECELVDAQSGLTVVANGELTARLSAAGICRSGVVPGGVAGTYRYRGFRATTSDGETVVETFDAPALTQRVEPRPGGCADGDGVTAYDGGLGLSRPGAADFELAFSEFEMDVRSSGSPCQQTVVLAGRVEAADRTAARAFEAEPHDAVILLPGAACTRAAIDGPVSIDCVGDVTYTTEQAIAVGPPCAAAGALRIELPSGVASRATLAAGGVAFDYDGDGRVDASLSSCVAPELARCATGG